MGPEPAAAGCTDCFSLLPPEPNRKIAESNDDERAGDGGGSFLKRSDSPVGEVGNTGEVGDTAAGTAMDVVERGGGEGPCDALSLTDISGKMGEVESSAGKSSSSCSNVNTH